MRRYAAIALAAMLAAAVLVTSRGEDEEPAVENLPAEFYGVAGHVMRLEAGAGRLAALERQLAGLAELDVAFVRANLDWLQLQPREPAGPADFDFRTHDDWVAALARQGLRWYVVGVGTPAWAAEPARTAAGCSIFAPPERSADYATMMEAIAKRYGSKGTFWSENPGLPRRPVRDYEVWNEPNLGGFWCPVPEPERYADLLAHSADAVVRADPHARIVLGGLAPFTDSATAGQGHPARLDAPTFLRRVQEARPELTAAIDAVGVHLYAPQPEGMLAQLTWYRGAMDTAGFDGTPISVNELGWPTQGSGTFTALPEATRAPYLGSVIEGIARSDCGVVSVAPHTWITEERDPIDQEHWFGLADPESGRPYPSGSAYEAAIDATPPGGLVAAESVRRTCVE
jgi:hypothetical protein